jgi:hypothetical protein
VGFSVSPERYIPEVVNNTGRVPLCEPAFLPETEAQGAQESNIPSLSQVMKISIAKQWRTNPPLVVGSLLSRETRTHIEHFNLTEHTTILNVCVSEMCVGYCEKKKKKCLHYIKARCIFIFKGHAVA